MLGLKSIFVEIGIAVGVVALVLLYLAGIRREGREEGKVEQYLANLKAKKQTLKIARDAKREFGSTVEDLEYDDKLQFKHGEPIIRENFDLEYDERGRQLQQQYDGSPFSRN